MAEQLAFVLRWFLDAINIIERIDPRSVENWLDAIAASSSTPTRNRARTALSRFFRWLRKQGYRPRTWNPLEDIPQLREERPAGCIVWFWKTTRSKRCCPSSTSGWTVSPYRWPFWRDCDAAKSPSSDGKMGAFQSLRLN